MQYSGCFRNCHIQDRCRIIQGVSEPIEDGDARSLKVQQALTSEESAIAEQGHCGVLGWPAHSRLMDGDDSRDILG